MGVACDVMAQRPEAVDFEAALGVFWGRGGAWRAGEDGPAAGGPGTKHRNWKPWTLEDDQKGHLLRVGLVVHSHDGEPPP